MQNLKQVNSVVAEHGDILVLEAVKNRNKKILKCSTPVAIMSS